MADAPEWPAMLMLRDTKVIADEGQRIFTTATGYGYEKQAYVRADLPSKLIEALEALTARDASYHGNEIHITCDSHGDAIRIMRAARSALSLAKGEGK